MRSSKSASCTGHVFVLSAVVVSLLVSIFLAVSPYGIRVESSVTTVGGAEDRNETRTGTERILSSLTVDSFILLVIPVAVAAGPVFFRRRRGAIVARCMSAVALVMWVLFLFFPWYLPAAVLMAVAAATAGGQVEASPETPHSPD